MNNQNVQFMKNFWLIRGNSCFQIECFQIEYLFLVAMRIMFKKPMIIGVKVGIKA